MSNIFKDLFEKITERFSVAIKLSKNCEANTFYRVEDLNAEDINYCAQYLAVRIIDTGEPDILIEMPGSVINLAQALAFHIGEETQIPKVLSFEEFNGIISSDTHRSSEIKGKNIAIINDVITTGRSCLEAHSKLTLQGANVQCWVALVDRTFGPGPVAVIATLTGDPVKLLD